MLVGDSDSGNPNAFPLAELEPDITGGVITYTGWRDDVAALYREAHIAVLPSYYGEGVPKTLIEAAACGLPIVTTGEPGCRDVVRDGVNGFLVPTRDAVPLADRLAQLVGDPGLRARMGAAGRQRAEGEFDLRLIVQHTLELYRRALNAANVGDGGA